jgi:antitoxin component HigA of HigAB toxin-antitoxin module
MAGMPTRICTDEQYRTASEEAQRLQGAVEGTAEFARLQEFRTAMQDYELQHLTDPRLPSGAATPVDLVDIFNLTMAELTDCSGYLYNTRIAWRC